MIYSRNYARMFVTLKQESSDYSSDFREAMGRCVIEVRFGKGRFSTYIQGLKQGDYRVLFISCKNGNNIGVDIGKICTDVNGKGEMKIEFDPKNVCDTNLKIEDFHVVGIMPYDDKNNKALLTGYVGGIVQWKEGFSLFCKEEKSNMEEKEEILENSEILKDIGNMEGKEDLDVLEDTNISNDKEDLDALEDTNISNDKEDLDALEDTNILEDKEDLNVLEDTNISEDKEDLNVLERGKVLKEETDVLLNNMEENKSNSQKEEVLKEEIDVSLNDTGENNNNRQNNIMSVLNQSCVCGEIGKEPIESVANRIIENRNKSDFETLNKAGKDFSDIVKKFKQGIAELENREKDVESCIKKDIEKEDYKKMNYGVNYIFENNIKMTPFQHQKKDINWVRIDLSELVVLPGKMWLYLNNPFVSFSEKKYKHLILGRFFERGKENYILGVPGKYFSDYRLEAGLQGFNQFKCCENKLPVDGDYGYWLLNIK